jgi:hypothetical protein
MTGFLFADVPPPPPPQVGKANPFLNPEFLVTVGLLVGALLLGAIVFAFVDRWRKRGSLHDSRRESTESLTSFRAMFDNGELTREEYEKIRDRMAAKMKKEVGVASTTPGGGGDSSGGTGRGEFPPGDGSDAAPPTGTAPK